MHPGFLRWPLTTSLVLAALPGTAAEDAPRKLMLVLEHPASGTHAALRSLVETQVGPQLASDSRAERVVVSLPIDAETVDPAVESMLEVYGEAEALRALVRELQAALLDRARVHAYLVRERVPRRYEKSWPDGTPSPGVRLLALIARHESFSAGAFDAYWRDEHTPLALAHTVAVRHYSQNTVVETLTAGSPRVDGIAGEQFDSKDFLEERRTGYPEQFERSMKSAERFIDLANTRSSLMIETVLKSGWTSPGPR